MTVTHYLLLTLCASTLAHAATPRLPLRFEPAAGHYIARGASTPIEFAPGRITMPGLRLSFPGANHHATLTPESATHSVSNYLTGNDPAQWRTAVPHYSRLRYRNLYPGIDLVFYGRDGVIEYDFEVAPGANPNAIHLHFESAVSTLAANGDLATTIDGNTIVHRRPVLYQRSGSHTAPVEGRFRLNGRDASFVIGSYDPKLPLIIDPVLTYSTYLGGSAPNSAEDIAYAATRDAEGNIYIAGRTASTNFPLAGAFQTTNKGSGDAFVAKFDPTGQTLKYATYFGGGSLEYAYAIAVDAQGQAHIAGQTGSRDFPVKNAFQSAVAGLNNAFLTKLNAQGNALLFSTVFGGERNDVIYSIALDSYGNIYAGGGTNSEKLPLKNPLLAKTAGNGDAFAAKFSPTGELFYSTFIGGTGSEIIYAVAPDSLGNLVVAGATNSLNLATADVVGPKGIGSRDAFVAKLNATGNAYVFFSYLGGRQGDEARALALDAEDNLYLGGNTFSTDFPVTDGVVQPKLAAWGDAFIAKLNSTATKLVWSTYLGGSGRSAVVEEELVTSLAVDPDGFVYAAGTTTSPDFPVQRAVQPTYGGGTDAFAAKLTPDGTTLVNSTFLGGAADETGNALVLTPLREIYVAGQTFSDNLPVTPKALAPKRGGNSDSFFSAVCDPVLFASNVTFDFSYTQGDTTPPPSKKLDVLACAKLPLIVQAAAESWLSVTPTESTLPATLTLAVKPDTLEPGDYTATFPISTPDSWFPPLTITVQLHVYPPPQQ